MKTFRSKFYAVKESRLYNPSVDWSVTGYGEKADGSVDKLTGITASLLHEDSHVYVCEYVDTEEVYDDVVFEVTTTDEDVSDVVCLDTTERSVINSVETASAAILEDTGTNIPASLATIQSDIDGIETDIAGIPAETWTYTGTGGRGLTMTPQEIKNLYESDTITIIRGSTNEIPITDITLYTHRQRFGVRKSKNHNGKYTLLVDSADGLMFLNEVALADLTGFEANDATLVYDDTEKSMTITLKPKVAAEFQKLQVRKYYWGAQGWAENGDVIERGGIFDVDEDTVIETELPASEE